MSCGVGHRRGSDLVFPWLWCRLAAAAPVQPLVWELPFATGAALKRLKKENKREERRTQRDAGEKNTGRNHEVEGSTHGLAQWVKDPDVAVSCGVGHRRGSDPPLL